VLTTSIVVLVIAQASSDPLTVAFERAARGALGPDANIELLLVAEDPPDEETAARGGSVDGVIELSWSATTNQARVHCYLAREQRWVDRQISFGASSAGSPREAAERGRLLGFAVATMFSDDAQAVPPAPPPTPALPPSTRTLTQPQERHAPPPRLEPGRTLEFAGIVSSGLSGTASGVGAMAGLRLAWTGPLWARLFVSGRAGSIPKAQATTRTAQAGAGLSIQALPSSSAFQLGSRVDLFASLFEASHLSEDDVAPDRRHRWLMGADVVAEAGLELSGSVGVFSGIGLEAVFGRTEVYTHGNRVAVVPPLRAVGELGFRASF
jgi:hypothetical protein